MIDANPPLALTFDDVLLLPAESDVLPRNVEVMARLTRNLRLNIPLVSSAMDTVTEARTAIAMAQEGGLGFIHKNLTIQQQALEVTKVKKYESGMVVDPVVIDPEAKLAQAVALMAEHQISGIPVTKKGRLVGILTNRDIRFEKNLEQKVGDVMTTKLITCREGISMDEAKDLLHRNRIEKLLVVDDSYDLRGLITIKDIEKTRQHPSAAKDKTGRLLVGAAVGVGPDRDERVHALLKAGCDVICVDTAHGHSRGVVDSVRQLKATFKGIELIAGNIATAEAAIDAKPAPTRSRSASAPARSAPPAWSRASASRRSARSMPACARPRSLACPVSPTAESSIRATSSRRSPPAPTP